MKIRQEVVIILEKSSNVSKTFRLTTLVSQSVEGLSFGIFTKSRHAFTNHRFLAPNVTNKHILNINCFLLYVNCYNAQKKVSKNIVAFDGASEVVSV